MTGLDDISRATEALRVAVSRLAETMRAHDLPGDPSLIEADGTRMAQDLTDATHMPLAVALEMITRQVDEARAKRERGRQ